MRWKAVLAILVAASLTACAGPKLRKAASVTPKRMSRECGVRKNVPLDEEQALCVAGLAGIDVSGDAYTMRAARAPSGAATWIIDEACGTSNPKCIGVVVQQADGAILDTRYLYVMEAYKENSR